jgi:hypothetical protein
MASGSFLLARIAAEEAFAANVAPSRRRPHTYIAVPVRLISFWS